MACVAAGSPVRGVGASLLFASVSALVDLSGQRLQPEHYSDTKRTFNYGRTAGLE